MKAIFKNIGLIRESEIELEGITVVAAPNDSGKSTISKTLFMFLEALSNFDEEFLKFRNQFIRVDVGRIFQWLNRTLDESEMEQFSKDFDDIFQDEILKVYIDKDVIIDEDLEQETISLEYNFALPWGMINSDSDSIKNFFERFYSYYQETIVEQNKIIKSIFEQIISYFEYSDVEKFNLVLKSKISSYFENDLTAHGINEKEDSEIRLVDSKSESQRSILLTQFSNQDVRTLEFQHKLNDFTIPLYLDSFINLENHRLNQNFLWGRSINESIRGKSDSIFKSLIESNDEFNPLREDIEEQESLFNEIINIIDGKVEKEAREIFFTKKNERFSIKNTATGIKIFGALQLILKNYSMTPDLFMIIDEPETNLHPVWQVKLSEIIVLLNKRLGMQFLINSHSSNFIEGIKLYSELHETEKIVRFYLINSETQTLENVTQNLQPAYDQLNGSLDILDEVARSILEKKERYSGN